MGNETKRLLKVFLCHASGDKPPVRQLYKELVAEGVDAWLDQEKLLPGQDWRLEIPRAVHEADVVVICLSKKSITKEGYVQKEIQFALDLAEEKPAGTIFLIPARLEDCPVPDRLSRWQWVDLYEENGFIKLLRSLKLRANVVGAVIEPTSSEMSDKELQRRLDQLYTDGLAAFYTEDWAKACFCFQTILSEQPSYRSAAEKLAEAEWERKLARLYARSSEALQIENWQVALETLEELVQKSPDYKDAAQLLRDAKKREQLRRLYAEARALHAAQKWQAVVMVFGQISVLEPNFPDPEGLLATAEKETAEAERQAGLKELYGQALREMDSGNWHQARKLLEQVRRSQTGFLETERLLRKVEAEEEIEKLQNHFEDEDGIAQQARAELEREGNGAQRQNQLAGRYAEAVRLLKEEKYQEALDQWHEIEAIDPMYKDGLQVKKAAEQKLDESTQLESIGRLSSTTINAKIGISFLVIIAIVTVAIIIYEGTRTKTFPNPMFEGYRLDFCFSLGHECGNPVAVKWCQRQGYGEFVHFELERVAGETKTFSGQICSNACDSFKSITCTLH